MNGKRSALATISSVAETVFEQQGGARMPKVVDSLD